MPTRVLIIDDDPGVRHALSEFLGRHDFAVTSTGDIEEGRQGLRLRGYDALIADLRLSGTEGSEGLEFLQIARESSPSTRCILLSAYVNETIAATAREAGAIAVIRKPVPLTFILAVLNLHIQGGNRRPAG